MFDHKFWDKLDKSLPGWMSKEEAEFLVENLYGRTYVEIGVAYGKSFRVVDHHFKGEWMRGVEIINHAEHYKLERLRQFMTSDKDRLFTRSPIHHESSKEFVKNISDGWVHTLFIDGAHTYEGCISDFVHWYNKVKTGGRIIFHDYGRPTKEHEGVTKIVDAIKPLLKDFKQTKFICSGVK